jgi:hypothetical protein
VSHHQIEIAQQLFWVIGILAAVFSWSTFRSGRQHYQEARDQVLKYGEEMSHVYEEQVQIANDLRAELERLAALRRCPHCKKEVL